MKQLTAKEKKAIKTNYKNGFSSIEIKEMLNIKLTVRTIQRYLSKEGLIRNQGEAFRNAMRRGRIKFVKKAIKGKRMTIPPTLRYEILDRDGFKCLLCGATAKTAQLEVDHIDLNTRNNDPKNLRTLCFQCNFGRPSHNKKNIYMRGVDGENINTRK